MDRGVTNAKFIWIMTDYAFWVGSQARNDATKWFPGDAYLDAMGVDAYNWYNCRTGISTAWKSLEQIIQPFRDFGANHPDKELWLTEWASTEDPANPAARHSGSPTPRRCSSARTTRSSPGSPTSTPAVAPCTWPDSSPPRWRRSGPWPRRVLRRPVRPRRPSAEPTEISLRRHGRQQRQPDRHTVQIPATVQAGDTLLLFFTGNQTATTTAPAGWSRPRSTRAGYGGPGLDRHGADAGATVTVSNSVIMKADLTVAAYRAAREPGRRPAVAVESTTRPYIAPSVTPTQSGDWVVVYWADKSDSNAGHTIPATLTRRRTASGSGGGHITATIADTGAAAGPHGDLHGDGDGDANEGRHVHDRPAPLTARGTVNAGRVRPSGDGATTASSPEPRAHHRCTILRVRPRGLLGTGRRRQP